MQQVGSTEKVYFYARSFFLCRVRYAKKKTFYAKISFSCKTKFVLIKKEDSFHSEYSSFLYKHFCSYSNVCSQTNKKISFLNKTKINLEQKVRS